jgi:hypothetical protein
MLLHISACEVHLVKGYYKIKDKESGYFLDMGKRGGR